MNILLRTPNGPLEGFEVASFRVAINDDGIGQIEGLPEVIDAITGPITVSVDGQDVFQFGLEERTAVDEDVTSVKVSGRGPSAALERAIILPAGYPAYTVRTRTVTAAPLAVFSQFLAEAQGRGLLAGYTPTWTATDDSNGNPWTVSGTFQLDPGTNLRDLLEETAEVEGSEWLVNPDLTIDAAPQLGTDRSGEVVLFVGRDQVSRGLRQSTRNQRRRVYLEASTGVSEAINTGLGADAGEIWLEGQDFADPLTRPIVAAKIAESLSIPETEVDVRVTPDSGAFTLFNVGDLVGLDTGSGPIQPVRVVGIGVNITDDVEVELTLVSEITLRQRKLDRAIQANADVQLAASTSFQRRHGLVTADKFLSGAVGTDVAIASSNYVPNTDGWAILGDGSAELNDVVIRGDIQSVNYVPGTSGWFLDRTGTLELNAGIFRGGLVGGTINIGGASGFFANGTDGIWLGSSSFATAPFRVNLAGALTATSGSISGSIIAAGISAANITADFLSVDRLQAGSITGAKIAGGTITGANISGGTITGANIAGTTITNANIVDGTIGGVQIADLAIIAAKIADGAAIRRTIALGSVNNVRVANDINGDRITAGTISGITGNFVGLTSVGLSVNINAINANAGIVSTSGGFSSIISNSGMPTSTDTGLPTVRRRGDNVLVSVASSAALKADLEEAPGDTRILDLKLRTWRSLADGDDPDRRFYGLVAEEVREAGLEALVYDDVDGRPSGVAYDMVGVHLLPIVRQLTDRITELEERLR